MVLERKLTIVASGKLTACTFDLQPKKELLGRRFRERPEETHNVFM
jgi:hypothetical protein